MANNSSTWIQAAAAVANVLVAAVLVGVTWFYALEARRQRVGAFVPYLLWQEPKAGIVSDTSRIRAQIDVVLWSTGPGAARLLRKYAVDGDGEEWEIDHVATPSLVPAGVVNTLHVYFERKVWDFWASADANAQTQTIILKKVELEIRLTYSDVSDGTSYNTKIVVGADFTERTVATTSPAWLDTRPIPSIAQIGAVEVPAELSEPDTRTARERRITTASAWRSALVWTSLAAVVALGLIAVGSINYEVQVIATSALVLAVAFAASTSAWRSSVARARLASGRRS